MATAAPEHLAWPFFDARHRAGSFANTTPATDGERVYAWFGSEGLYAYDFTGKLAWKKSRLGSQ